MDLYRSVIMKTNPRLLVEQTPRDDGIEEHLVGCNDVVEVIGLRDLRQQVVPRTLQHLQTERERNVLFNDALNTFYLWLYGVRYMVKDHSDSEKGNLLPPHGLLFPISSKGSFICTIPQTG